MENEAALFTFLRDCDIMSSSIFMGKIDERAQ